jgi:hypothetical protein
MIHVLLFLATIALLAILAGLMFGFVLGFAIHIAFRALILLALVAGCLWLLKWLWSLFAR